MSKPLWSDDNTEKEMQKFHKEEIIYNLMEDIQCLKESLSQNDTAKDTNGCNIRHESQRTFKHFPKDIICPLCGTSEDKECCLIFIDGTDDNGICEAKPMHVDCMTQLDMFRYNQKMGILYRKI